MKVRGVIIFRYVTQSLTLIIFLPWNIEILTTVCKWQL